MPLEIVSFTMTASSCLRSSRRRRPHLHDDDDISHDFSLFPSHDLYLYITFFSRSLSHDFLFFPVSSYCFHPTLPPTLFLSLHISRDLISSLTFPFTHSFISSSLSITFILSLFCLSLTTSPQSHSQLLCYCSLLLFLMVSLFISLKFLSSYCLTFSSSLCHSLSVALATISPSHHLTLSYLTISPRSSINFHLSHLNLSSHFVDLSFSLSSHVSLSSSLISLSLLSQYFPPLFPSRSLFITRSHLLFSAI